uniref:Uncharacterized protein n=1 Tax=Arundo donax TaxID=35708 RepID=A0A0A9HBC6_ARUDO
MVLTHHEDIFMIYILLFYLKYHVFSEISSQNLAL